jgi:hypothetical protein
LRRGGVGGGSGADADSGADSDADADTGLLHIDAPQAVSLETLTRDGDWTRVCSSPCDASVPVGATYRIRGAGGVRDD